MAWITIGILVMPLEKGLSRIDLENYALDLHRRDEGTLIVTFEPMTACLRNPSRTRPGWGAKYLDTRPESTLYVKTTAPHWYRRRDLFQWLDDSQSFFSGFDRIILMGGSMGGYAALAFGQAMQATDILSLNPQSTLAKDLVPWESRFAKGKMEDWSGEFRDAAETTCGNVYVIADRYDDMDYAHVKRLRNIQFSNFPFVGHKIPAWLLQLGALKPVISTVLDSRSPKEVNAAISIEVRTRRKLERWWVGMVAAAHKQGRIDRLKPFLSSRNLAGILPLKPDGLGLARLQAAFCECVAENLIVDDPAAADVWTRRAKEALVTYS
jgi:hypothetical protein